MTITRKNKYQKATKRTRPLKRKKGKNMLVDLKFYCSPSSGVFAPRAAKSFVIVIAVVNVVFSSFILNIYIKNSFFCFILFLFFI